MKQRGQTSSTETEVATVTALECTIQDGNTTVYIGIEPQCETASPSRVFDGHSLLVGTEVTIVTNEGVWAGRVAAVGSDDPKEFGES